MRPAPSVPHAPSRSESLRDLIAVFVWIVSFAGHTVVWRGQKFELKNGRLIRIGA